jgi:hypothetical protein
VIEAGLQVVDTDSVDLTRYQWLRQSYKTGETYTQALHEGSITQTDIAITQRILLGGEARRATGLITKKTMSATSA